MKAPGSKRTIAKRQGALRDKLAVSEDGEQASSDALALMRSVHYLHRFCLEHEKHKGDRQRDPNLMFGPKVPIYTPSALDAEKQWVRDELLAVFSNAIIDLNEGFFSRCLEAVRLLKAGQCDRSAVLVLHAIYSLTRINRAKGTISSGEVLKLVDKFQAASKDEDPKVWDAKDVRDIATQLGYTFPIRISEIESLNRESIRRSVSAQKTE